MCRAPSLGVQGSIYKSYISGLSWGMFEGCICGRYIGVMSTGFRVSRADVGILECCMCHNGLYVRTGC